MTAARIRSTVTGDASSSAHARPQAPRGGSRLPSVSIALGTLSIASFWVFGLGFVLGVSAVVCGALATSRSGVADDEPASLRALLGVVAGVAGITVSAIALFPVLEYL
ncbi:hypothetical protein [Rhodococcus jostii]|uniref:DUF4190 domain-containing protein n=1 Tax=Rhodococcus jostii TaxID=132919 RepID=A0A1H4IIN3_RHOJO|nr:hypothetical protein [Rhodococcus jostii]SEB33850.1 hypothetical protein SAMN04490220_0039 [Rhodococcus jostii]